MTDRRMSGSEATSVARVREERVQQELSRALRARLLDDSLLVLLGHTALMMLIAVLIWEQEPGLRLKGWTATVILATIIRTRWLRRAAHPDITDRKVLVGMRAVVLLQGLAWGVGAAVVLPSIPMEHVTVVLVVLSAIVAGSLSTLAADPPSFFRLLAAIAGPLPFGLLALGMDRLHIVVAGLVLVFAGVILVLYRRAHRALTDQLRTGVLLSISEEEKSLLLESTAEGIYGIDLEGNCTFCNPAGLRLLGYDDPRDVLGKSMHAIAHHSRADGTPWPREACHILQSLREGRGTYGDDEVFWRADGSHFAVEYWAYPIRRERVLVGAVVTFLDITARKRTERALLESEARFRRISESNIIGIGFWDASGVITEANDEYLRTTGYTRDDLRAGRLNFRAMTPPEYAAADMRALEHIFAGEAVAPWEKDLLRKDGGRVPVVVGVAPLKDRLDQGVVFQLDISKRKRAEEEARSRAALLEAQVNSSVDGILIVDREGKKLLQNQRFFELWKIPPAIAADEDDAQTLQFALSRTRHPKEFLDRVDYLYAHPHEVSRDEVELTDGTVFDRYSSPVTGGKGESYGRIWAFRDVTAQKQTAELMRQARDLAERAAQTRSMFLANMSHEIRTPMNAVLGMVEIVLDTDLTGEQRHSLELVRSSGESLLTLLNDILDYSKIEAGHLDVEAIPFDLSRLLHSTASLLAVRAREKNLELVPDLAADVPDWVTGDPSRLRQVLTNLIGNAIKFTQAGEVVVSVRPAPLDDHRAGLRFSVRDTGIGISPDRMQHIFEEFTQADGSTSRRYGGTGLGLTIAQRLVGLMGGRITVTSEVGRGSEFAFVLPLSARGTPVAARPAAPVSLAGRRIVLVDDNGTNRRVFREILTAEGARVDEASDAASGLAALRVVSSAGAAPALAIIDVRMPGPDGFELAAEIRGDKALADTPILMLTSAGQRGDAARCRELAVSGYLTKPMSRSDLLEAVAAILGGSPSGDAERSVITRHSLTETRRPLHILLAEDNPVNQEVAATMLSKRGHRVDTVVNGREAVAAVQRTRYDLVLMDIQMPEMDGFEATAAIRALGDRGRLPIVALTAHALSGERERCLSHGMDGYLAKPFRAHELFASVEGWGAHPVQPAGAEAPRDAGAAVNLDVLRTQLRDAGSEDALDGIVDTFLASVPARVATLGKALTSGTVAEIVSAAHALKSSAGAIGAQPLAALLAEVEAAGRKERLTDRPALADRVQAAAALVLAYLQAYRRRAA